MSRIVLLLGFFLFACQSFDPSGPPPGEEKEFPHDFMFMQRAYPTGELKSEAYARAIRWKQKQIASVERNKLWEFVGPENVGGRITDIEIPVDQAETYYIGGASGGIFKTTDAGEHWSPIFDGQEILSIGDIAISDNNSQELWVGTGEVNAGGGSLAYDGNGVYKSEDGGLTWEDKALSNVGSIGKILIHPDDDHIVYIAAMGPLFRNDSHRGLFRSNNDGADWEKILFISDSTGIIDLAMNPENPDIIYAAAWERVRRPNRRQYGGATTGIYRTIDGGDHWEELTQGLPSAPHQKGRIGLDISRSEPEILYARYADASGDIQGVYKTNNGGNSWSAVSSNQLQNIGFHWWFSGIYVDPEDADVLYNVDFQIQKSIDGGMTWFPAFPGVHVDQHALAFNPSVPGEVLLGNDGGLYVSEDDGLSSTKNRSLPLTQCYRIHVDAGDERDRYAGTQDNGTVRTLSGGLTDWSRIYGGDGFQPLVHPTNSEIIFALSQRGHLVKSVDGGEQFFTSMTGISLGDRRNWDTPVLFDPSDPTVMYYGSHRVYKSTDLGEHWTPISPDLSKGPNNGNLTFGTITSISVSPLDPEVIFVGTDDGNVWVTQDGGAGWEHISEELPNRWVTKVLAAPDAEQEVYVTFSGYRFGENDGHVFHSSTAGSQWENRSHALPDIPVNDILKDRYGNLYLGTDIGVLISENEGTTWYPPGLNLPSVVVNDMHIHRQTDQLYVGTYGRGMYALDISENPVQSVDPEHPAVEPELFPNPAASYVHVSIPDGLDVRSIRLIDQMGRSVRTMTFDYPPRSHRMDLRGIPGGCYYLQFESSRASSTKQLIIR